MMVEDTRGDHRLARPASTARFSTYSTTDIVVSRKSVKHFKYFFHKKTVEFQKNVNNNEKRAFVFEPELKQIRIGFSTMPEKVPALRIFFLGQKFRFSWVRSSIPNTGLAKLTKIYTRPENIGAQYRYFIPNKMHVTWSGVKKLGQKYIKWSPRPI
jgi:hypothetical protein